MKEINEKNNLLHKNNNYHFDKHGEVNMVTSMPDSERAQRQYDERRVEDDANDFVFMSPKKYRKKSHKGSSSESKSSDDLTIIKSDRSTPASGFGRKHHSHRKSKKKKMKTWKKILISIVSVLLGLVLVFSGIVFLLWHKGSQELSNPTDLHISAPDNVQKQNQGEYVVYNGKTYKFNKNIVNTLLMGVDNRTIDGDRTIGSAGQSDVNILMSIDTSTGKTTLFNISRDSMVDVSEYSAGGAYVGMEKMQLCLAYSFGDGKETSCENQVEAVQRLFYNIPINTYFALDLDGISAVNDSIGGVDVVCPISIGDTFIEGETYHLVGDMAEKFVRIRDMDVVDANNSRMARQKAYIQSFINTVIQQTKEDISTPLDIFNAVGDYSCTNLNASRIMYLAGVAVSNQSMSYEMCNVPGEVKMGDVYAEYYVNEKEFYEMFLNVYYTPMD